MQRLWTPWRMRYVSGQIRDDSCIFCAKPAQSADVEELILFRGRLAYVIMNLYPYNSGHVMVVPYQHVADIRDLDRDAVAELFGLLPWVTAALQRVLDPDGFNIGLNLGSVAGAGVADHLHIHVVPRWQGDANFMPIIANTMVLPELLPITYGKIRAELELADLRSGGDGDSVPQAGAIPILPRERKVALRRARDGTIVLPKGHIEEGEAVFQTAMREVSEEMGLQSEPTGWGGVLEFEAGDRRRRVVYLPVLAQPGADFGDHLDRDTVLYAPADAIDAPSHEPARRLLAEVLPRFRDELGGCET
jgi:ATP adenylyltransferase